MDRNVQTNKSAMESLADFICKSGLDEEQALKLLHSALKQRSQVMERARQVLNVMEALDDKRFTPETLRANPEALRALEEGKSIGEVYRMYFIGEKREDAQETEANLGLGNWLGSELTPGEIERISAYVSKTGQTYEMD